MNTERCITYDKKFKKYRVRVQRGYRFDGQPNKRNGTANSLKEARELRAQFEYELSKLDSSKICNVTLDLYAKDFFERKKKDGYAKEYTVDAQYRKYKNNISPILGRKILDEIKPRDIKNLIRYLQEEIIVKRKGIIQKKQRLANNTISINIFPLIKEILEQARIDEYIKKNPTNDIKKPKITDGTVKPFTIQDWYKIRAFTDKNQNPNMRIGIPLLYYTAGRKGEILGLQWKNIDFINNIIVISKQYNAVLRKITDTKTSDSNDKIPFK